MPLSYIKVNDTLLTEANYIYDYQTGVLVIPKNKLTGNVEIVIQDCWNGVYATQFAGGNGTEESPYLIRTPEQLMYLRSNEWTTSTYFEIMNDIYMNDETFTVHEDLGYITVSDGVNSSNFGMGINGTTMKTWLNGTYAGELNELGMSARVNGIINGNNHSIYGWFGVELLSYFAGKISNLTMKTGCTFSTDDCLGSFIWRLDTDSVIDNCRNYITVLCDHPTSDCVGGVVAICQAGTYMINCSNYGVICGGAHTGGVMGLLPNSSEIDAKVLNSANYGNIYNSGEIGGVVGIYKDQCSGVGIYNTFSSGTLTTTSVKGGIIGYSYGTNSTKLGSNYYKASTATYGWALKSINGGCTATTDYAATATALNTYALAQAEITTNYGTIAYRGWTQNPTINNGYPYLVE